MINIIAQDKLGIFKCSSVWISRYKAKTEKKEEITISLSSEQSTKEREQEYVYLLLGETERGAVPLGKFYCLSNAKKVLSTIINTYKKGIKLGAKEIFMQIPKMGPMTELKAVLGLEEDMFSNIMYDEEGSVDNE